MPALGGSNNIAGQACFRKMLVLHFSCVKFNISYVAFFAALDIFFTLILLHIFILSGNF
jgi:hypothetical protein